MGWHFLLFANCKRSTVEILEGINNFSQHFIMDMITYPCCKQMGPPGAVYDIAMQFPNAQTVRERHDVQISRTWILVVRFTIHVCKHTYECGVINPSWPGTIFLASQWGCKLCWWHISVNKEMKAGFTTHMCDIRPIWFKINDSLHSDIRHPGFLHPNITHQGHNSHAHCTHQYISYPKPNPTVLLSEIMQ